MDLEGLAAEVQMDLPGTLARLGGSRPLTAKFLRKFAQDPTYAALKTAVEQGDLSGIERSAHTLKGVAANLGLEAVRRTSDALVQAVRGQRQSEIPTLFMSLQNEYEKAGRAIDALEE